MSFRQRQVSRSSPAASATASAAATAAAASNNNATLAAWTRFFNKHAPPSSHAPSRTVVRSEADYAETMRRLRRLILSGVPNDDFTATPFGGAARPLIWKLLLNVNVSASDYLALVARGPSKAHAKIKNDTFRTLATDQGFKRRVKEDMLIRLLEAFVWRNTASSDDEHDETTQFSYVQGMNVLAAPFLYAMQSELEAFWCFTTFIEDCCPMYVQPTLAGVHAGLDLLDRCLYLADPSLFTHLRSKNLTAELYAFPSVLTLCACTPPLDQVLQLWDFLLAFGVHLNILCVVAQLLLMRNQLMASQSPMKLLRTFPPLQAQAIIGICLTLVRDLPNALYDELVRHPFEPLGDMQHR